MYAELRFMYPMLQSSPHSLHNELPFVDPHMSQLVQTSSILEYDLGAEGDLFKAPEPVIEEPPVTLDPLSAAMTIISNGQNVMTETIDVADMASIQNDNLQNALYECEEELLAKYAITESFPALEDAKEELLATYAINEPFPASEDAKEELFAKYAINQSFPALEDAKEELLAEYAINESFPKLEDVKRELLAKYAINELFPELEDVKIPVLEVDEVTCLEKVGLGVEGQMQKSVSSGCLNSMEWIRSCTMGPNFLDFQGVDFETAFGLRRAYSEGDIQALGNITASFGNASNIRTSFERQLTISELKTEERKQKLSRYRKKRSKRNFGRKIKYACRKVLADSQPRVRGRFAKTDNFDMPKPCK